MTARHHAIPTHTIVATIATLPDCFSVPLDPNVCGRQLTCPLLAIPLFGTLGLRDGKEPQRLIYYESSSLCSPTDGELRFRSKTMAGPLEDKQLSRVGNIALVR